MSRPFRAAVVAAAVLATLTVAEPATATAPPTLSVTASTVLGGPANEWIEDAVRGSDGSWYAALGLDGADFPADPGGQHGGNDVVVARIAPDLRTVTWATTIGGSKEDYATSIALDPAGDPVVLGVTESGDFPTTAGAFQTTGTDGVDDSFVATLSAATGAVSWATRVGGTAKEEPLDMTVGPDGRVWIVGDTASASYPAAGGGTGTKIGDNDAFLTAIAPGGASLAYSTLLGASEYQALSSVQVGPDGRLYTLGAMEDWTPSVPVTDLAPADDNDFLLLRWSITGPVPTLERATALGGTGHDYIGSFSVAPDGAVYLGWFTSWGGVPLVAPIQDHAVGGDGLVLQKLAPSGTSYEWSTYFGGSGSWQTVRSILVDAWGSVYFAGSTNAPDTTLLHPVQPGYGGGYDAYLVKMTSDGRLVHSSYVGGAGYDGFSALGADPGGDVVALGASAQDGWLVRFEESAQVTGLTGPTATTDTTPSWQFGTDLTSARTECRLDGGAWAACSAAYTAPALGDGTHTFAVRAVASPGATPQVATASVVVDTTADTVIGKHPKKKTRKARAAFAFTSEPGATFSCKVDKKPWKACGPQVKVKVKKGKHVLQVRATDSLGNTDATPAVFRWKRVR